MGLIFGRGISCLHLIRNSVFVQVPVHERRRRPYKRDSLYHPPPLYFCWVDGWWLHWKRDRVGQPRFVWLWHEKTASFLVGWFVWNTCHNREQILNPTPTLRLVVFLFVLLERSWSSSFVVREVVGGVVGVGNSFFGIRNCTYSISQDAAPDWWWSSV